VPRRSLSSGKVDLCGCGHRSGDGLQWDAYAYLVPARTSGELRVQMRRLAEAKRELDVCHAQLPDVRILKKRTRPRLLIHQPKSNAANM